jgi:calcineurin-like phosphoesterase family protein
MKIILEKNQNIWFSSDSHYNHSGICRSVSHWPDKNKTRDFKSLEEMNSVIANNINAKVGPDDILVHLGDWSFGGFDEIIKFRERLVCQNIFLFLGNHDHHIKKDRGGVKKYFTEVTSYDILEIKENSHVHKFVCCHFPLASWDQMGKGMPHLHGHLHSPPHLKIHAGKAMDVGADGNNLMPYSLKEITKILEPRPIRGIVLKEDHHF